MQPSLVYDGDCGICQASVDLLRRVGLRADVVPSFQWVRAHPEHAELVQSTVLFVAPDGTVSGEEQAVANALRRCDRRLAWTGEVVAAPGIRTVARWVYRAVAARRTRISSALGLRACSLDDHAGHDQQR